MHRHLLPVGSIRLIVFRGCITALCVTWWIAGNLDPQRFFQTEGAPASYVPTTFDVISSNAIAGGMTLLAVYITYRAIVAHRNARK